MWMRLLQDFDYRPTAASTVAYLSGGVYNAPSVAVSAAVLAGKAVRLRAPRKGEVATYVHVDTVETVGADGWLRTERVGEPVFLKDDGDGTEQ